MSFVPVFQWPSKDPEEFLDFDIDWTKPMSTRSDDYIVQSDWTLISGDPTLGTGQFAPSNSLTVTKVWLAAGSLGSQAVIKNVVRTFFGRIGKRTVAVDFTEK